MIVKATLAKLVISEVPTTLFPDGRNRPPHLRSWRGGWRHLRFLLMMSPRWLLLYPGFALMTLGISVELAILHNRVVIDGVGFDIHTMLYASSATILGLQLILFSLIARAIGCLKRVFPLVVQESMACGTPALVSTETAQGCPSAHTLLLHEAGTENESDDEARWLICINAFKNQISTLQSMRSAVAEFAPINWNWSYCASQYEKILHCSRDSQ